MTTAQTTGEHVPELDKHPTTRQLVQYAGAVGDFHEHHYDLPFIQSLGIPNVLVHGSLQAAWLAQLAADVAGEGARVVSFDATYVRMAFPGPYVCRGRVARRDGARVELELWGEDTQANRCTTATATIAPVDEEDSP